MNTSNKEPEYQIELPPNLQRLRNVLDKMRATPYRAIPYHAIVYYTVLYYSTAYMIYYGTMYNTMTYSNILLYNEIL